ncbi:MAG: 3-deoxy-7-phosphoheptulonate synthase [Planctomycetota bacterium]
MRKTVSIADFLVGGDTFVVMAGPCAVESKEQLFAAADSVAAAGAAMLRGGAYKPRTSPKSFQGLGPTGLDFLLQASQRTGLPVVTEVLDPRDVERVAQHAAMLQVGSRNMQNFPLLREVGRQRLPVLLKRGAAATVDELLYAAEYITNEGNGNVLLCERGIRSFDHATRYVLDLAVVPLLRERCEFPIIVDPSHGTGRTSLVRPMALAAAAAGADGLLIEVHAEPHKALCDGMQALLPADFVQMMVDLRRLLPMLGRRLVRPGVSGHGAAANGTISDEFIAP